MITGELKNRIDSLWEIFWTGGLTNPLDVIEQMTYLMFIHDLDVSDNTHAKEKTTCKGCFSYRFIFYYFIISFDWISRSFLFDLTKYTAVTDAPAASKTSKIGMIITNEM